MILSITLIQNITLKCTKSLAYAYARAFFKAAYYNLYICKICNVPAVIISYSEDTKTNSTRDFNPFGTAIWNNFIFSEISFITTYLESHWYAESLKKWKLWEMKNYNLASAVTVSEKSGAISGNRLPEMPTGKTELN